MLSYLTSGCFLLRLIHTSSEPTVDLVIYSTVGSDDGFILVQWRWAVKEDLKKDAIAFLPNLVEIVPVLAY